MERRLSVPDATAAVHHQGTGALMGMDGLDARHGGAGSGVDCWTTASGSFAVPRTVLDLLRASLRRCLPSNSRTAAGRRRSLPLTAFTWRHAITSKKMCAGPQLRFDELAGTVLLNVSRSCAGRRGDTMDSGLSMIRTLAASTPRPSVGCSAVDKDAP